MKLVMRKSFLGGVWLGDLGFFQGRELKIVFLWHSFVPPLVFCFIFPILEFVIFVLEKLNRGWRYYCVRQ